MNYRNQALRELLAGEYVLGLLHGAARRRFERLLMEDGRLRAEVTFWEERFAGWALNLNRLAPRAAVWSRLKKHISTERRSTRRYAFPHLAKLWAGGLTAAAALLVLGIIVGRGIVSQPTPGASYVAVMSSPQSGPRWLISIDAKSGRVDMKALAENTPPPGKSYELWMLPGNGKPVPMGLMNTHGSASEILEPGTFATIAEAKGLAITLEPEGGSPTGQPTGPLVYSATLVAS